MNSKSLVFASACVLSSANSNAEYLNHVASLTFEDTAGSVKTQLERTSSSKCQRKLEKITREANAQPGITRIVSAKCGEITAVAGYFERKSMGVPYITVGDNSILIIRGASKNVCNNLAYLVRQTGTESVCVFPSKFYQ